MPAPRGISWVRPHLHPFVIEDANPHVFPYGRGGPNDPARRYPVSFLEFSRHLMLLGDMRFARCVPLVVTLYRACMRNAASGVAFRGIFPRLRLLR